MLQIFILELLKEDDNYYSADNDGITTVMLYT